MERKCFKQSWQPVVGKTNIRRMSKCTFTALTKFKSDLCPPLVDLPICKGGRRKKDKNNRYFILCRDSRFPNV